MPEMNVTGATTFTQIQQQFGQGKDVNHNIRFQDGKGLYTSGSASMTGIKAFFGDHTAMTERLQKRNEGMSQIKQAIDREYNSPGLGNRVLQHLNETRGMAFSEGVRGSDLAAISEGINELRQLEQFDQHFNAPGIGEKVVEHLKAHGTDFSHGIRQSDHAAIREAYPTLIALNDPDLTGATQHSLNESPRMMRLAENHFGVLSSAKFWENPQVRPFGDNIGCALSMTVLNRMQQSGTITQQDLNDLQRAMGPYVSGQAIASSFLR